MNAPGERIALGFAKAKRLLVLEQPHRRRLEHRRSQEHGLQGVLRVLTGGRAAGEERLQRLRGELNDGVAVDPAGPAALELELDRREHAQPHGSVWTITSATSGLARRSRSSTSLARAWASASVAPGSSPSVTKATTP